MNEDSQSAVNPYETPYADETSANFRDVEVATDVYSTIGHVVVTWEWLRLMYNAILVLVSLVAILIGPRLQAVDEEFGVSVVLGIFIANAAFCLGPLIDGYLTWFGLRSRVVTTVLFVAGTAIASLLALVSIVTWGMP